VPFVADYQAVEVALVSLIGAGQENDRDMALVLTAGDRSDVGSWQALEEIERRGKGGVPLILAMLQRTPQTRG